MLFASDVLKSFPKEIIHMNTDEAYTRRFIYMIFPHSNNFKRGNLLSDGYSLFLVC